MFDLPFDESPFIISGDRWYANGSVDYWGTGLGNGGWDAILAMFRYLDTQVQGDFTGPEMLAVGIDLPIVSWVCDQFGYTARTTRSYDETYAAFEDMQNGTYWPRLIYFGGTSNPAPSGTLSDWNKYSDIRFAIADASDFLNEWVRAKKSGIYSPNDSNFSAWLPNYYLGQVIWYQDYNAGRYQHITDYAATKPELANLTGYIDRRSGLTNTYYQLPNDSWSSTLTVPHRLALRVSLNILVVTCGYDGPDSYSAPVTLLGLPAAPGVGAQQTGENWFSRLPEGI